MAAATDAATEEDLPAPRTATLILTTRDGEVLGVLPPFPVATPWWQDAEAVVQGARQHHRIDVIVLRMVETERPAPPGGRVSYLVEVVGDPAAVRGTVAHVGIAPSPDDERAVEEHALRMPWARPGGPDADVAWARAAASARGLRSTGPPEQVRTWNLSSLWRLPLTDQTAWLKVVPPFFDHEGALLERLEGAPVPRLIAHAANRMLLAEIPGEDLYEAPLPRLLDMVSLLVALQRAWTDRLDELLGLGLPDRRAGVLGPAIIEVIRRGFADVPTGARAALRRFVDGLDDRLAEVARCGIADTLVHGDFHPGNFRGSRDDGSSLVLLDWGDSCVGHPLLDEAAFLDRIPARCVPIVRRHWHAEWRRAVPGSDPERATALLAPVAAARQAVIYQEFLDAIEPSEHPYHRQDPAAWLIRTAALVTGVGNHDR